MPGTGKATNFKIGRDVHRVHPNRNPLKILEKWEHGRIQGLPTFFWISHIISRTSKATNFKFGLDIYRVHPNKCPLKILTKKECGRIHGLPNFFNTSYYPRNG